MDSVKKVSQIGTRALAWGGVSRQWRRPRQKPPTAPCSCTPCCPIMARAGTGQHEGAVAVREAARHTGAAEELPVQPFDDAIGTDAGPVRTGKTAVSQRFLNAALHLPCGLFQLHGTRLLHYGFGALTGDSLSFRGVDRLEHLSHQLCLGARRCGEHIAVKVDGTALVLGLGEHFSRVLRHTKGLVAHHQLPPSSTRSRSR